jgi:ArsR family transcriptional regulator
MNNWNAAASLFKLLGHPARLEILGQLRDSEECVCHLEARLGYRQAYISQHLMALREAGLVQDRRDGPNIYYRVTEPQIFQVIDAGLRLPSDGAPRPQRAPARSANCPCPKCQPARLSRTVALKVEGV